MDGWRQDSVEDKVERGISLIYSDGDGWGKGNGGGRSGRGDELLVRGVAASEEKVLV